MSSFTQPLPQVSQTLSQNLPPLPPSSSSSSSSSLSKKSLKRKRIHIDDSSDGDEGGDNDMDMEIVYGFQETAHKKKHHHNHNHHSKKNPSHRSRKDVDLDDLEEDPGEDQLDTPADQIPISCDTKLSQEQEYALKCVMGGESVFITGPSGTGKTVCLKAIIKALKRAGDSVAVTASTSQGAMQLGGKTIHSFSGLRRVDDPLSVIRQRAKTALLKSIYNKIDVIVVDDINMLDPTTFRKILVVSQEARCEKKQDIQWVLCGDFLQLPPVESRSFKKKKKKSSDVDDINDQSMDFCFELDEWNKVIHRTIVFKETQLYKNPTYFEFLKDIRKGAGDRIKHHSMMNARVDGNLPNDDIIPTQLGVSEDIIQAENIQKMKKLKTHEYTFYGQKGYVVGEKIVPYNIPSSSMALRQEVEEIINQLSVSERKRYNALDYLEKNCPVEGTLVLKKDAQVMLIVDLDYDRGLLAGSRGVVIGFTKTFPHYPIVKFGTCTATIRSNMWTLDVGVETKVWYSQIPLKLAWYFSVYRMQGYKIDRASINLKDIYCYGQAYTALSKVRALDMFTLSYLDFSCVKAHPKALKYYDEVEPEAKKRFDLFLKKGSI